MLVMFATVDANYWLVEGRMRFRMTVRIAMGLAAAGGVIIALSGTAAAADAPVVNSPQDSRQTTANVMSPAANSVTTTGQNDSSSTTVTKQTQSTVTPGSVSNDGNNNGNGKAAESQPSSVNTDPGKGPRVGSSGGTVAPGTGSGDQSASASTAEAKPVVPVEVKVEAAKLSDPGGQPQLSLPPVIRFRSELLPVQPTIVSYEPAPADFAAALPSAPMQRQQPHPAKSSGLLGSLTVVLAGTVVPQPLMLGGLGIVPLAATLILGLLLVVLLTVFVFTYGSWLRRGGFATAARSDEPAFLNSLSIATPLLLGYVTSPWRMRSPILVVADIQSTHKLWFPTLTERRIRI